MSLQPLYRLPGQDHGARAIVRRLIVLGVLALTALAWVLTQLVAHRLRYAPSLGEGWNVISEITFTWLLLVTAVSFTAAVMVLSRGGGQRLGWGLVALSLSLVGLTIAAHHGPIYPPFQILVWWRRFGDVPAAAVLLVPYLDVLRLTAFGLLGVLLMAGVIVAGRRDRHDVHGSARWATHQDVERAGLLGSRGILLGLWHHSGRIDYLRHDGPEHVFVFAPTRTGKGVGLVLPNLLSWPHSVLVHDIKGENWALTAGWRSRELGSRCLRFDPTDTEGQGARYNPLEEIRLGPQEVRDAQNVADILVDPNGDRVRDHWDRTAHALLVGLILHVLYAEPDKTLRGCVHLLTDPNRQVDDTLESMITAVHDPEGEHGWTDPLTGEETLTHPLVASAARALLDKSGNERSGVLSTALSFLDLYRDPIVAANTETSDFRLTDLVNAEKPLSLYLTVPPSDLSRTRPLVRMILNQALRRLTETMHFEDGRATAAGRHPLLLMLDEFPALGRLRFFEESLAYIAGYGLRAVLITQDLSQHYGAYGREESITGNCHIRIAYTANKPETADVLSRMAGEMTVHLEQSSRRPHGFGSRTSHTTQQTGRRLLTPDEAMRLPADDALIFVAGEPPIRASKIRYYEDEELTRRAGVRILPGPETARNP